MDNQAWSRKTLVQRIVERQSQAQQMREVYDDRFADIVDFVQPGLTAWDDLGTEGTFRGGKIYEGTPPWALRVMTNGWLGNLVSEALRWFKYTFSDKFLKGNDSVNQHLQDREDHMYSVYQQSELYAALSPFARAAFSVGSPVVIPYEDSRKGRICFDVPHPRENYHLPYGGYHRKFTKTALEVVMDFYDGTLPENTEDIPLSNELINQFKNGNHTQRFTFIRAIYQQDDPIFDDQPLMYHNRPWMDFYVQEGLPETKQQRPLRVDGHWTRPHIRWDYELNTDEFYARTPAWHAMMDIRSGQEIAKQIIESGQRALHPPMWIQRKYLNTLQLRPKGRTVYDTSEEAEAIPRAIQERINYPHGKDVYDMTRDSVNRWFHVELFSILTRLSQEKQGWPTATHILHLNAEKAVLLAPHIGRFTHVIRQIDDRCQDLERRAGRGPMAINEMPDILLEYMSYKKIMGQDRLTMDVEFIGPLAQIQQKSLTVGRVQLGLALQKEFMAVDPMLRHKTRNSVAYEKALEQVGYPQDAIVPEVEYQEILSGIAQKQEQEQQQAQSMAALDTLPKMSKAIEPGSPLGAAMEAAQAGR